MQHKIPLEKLGPAGPEMVKAVTSCVHCGFCLPVCPTYKILGEEMDSPRGRIFLMKNVLEENLQLEEALPYIDKCLGCQACVPACPSGVEYGALLTPFLARAEKQRKRGILDKISRLLLHNILPFPGRFRSALQLGRLTRPLRHLLPTQMGAMLELLPDRLPKASPLPEIYPASGERRARVALLTGCVQKVLAPQINWATLRVLSRNGVEVVIPRNQTCCGSLAMHSGEADLARQLAQQNFNCFTKDVDAVVTNAAGCSSGMKEYPLLFKGMPQQENATALASRVKDVTVFLDELGIEEGPSLSQPLTLAYHDACHLAHAQGISAAPRRLLGSIANLSVIDIHEGDLCCGSAGTYNLEQPELAHTLGQRKVENILRTQADAVATGNIGCMMQIQNHLKALDNPLPVYHTVEILDRAYNTD